MSSKQDFGLAMRSFKKSTKKYLKDLNYIFAKSFKSQFCKDIKLPNFLVVGFPKSGTTSLHRYLKQHPEVFLSKQKELHFFDVTGLNEEQLHRELFPYEERIQEYITRDIAEYKAHFCGAKNYKMVGEMTPSYANNYERAIENIYKYLENPRNIKIIIMLREPTKACFSHYTMQRNKGLEFLEFEDSIAMSNIWSKYNHYRRDHIRTFMYSESIKKYQEEFDDVLVVLNEDLRDNPKETLKKVCEFLEVDQGYEFSFEDDFNVGRYKRRINDETRKKLYEIYKEDIKKTEQLIGKDLSKWRLE